MRGESTGTVVCLRRSFSGMISNWTALRYRMNHRYELRSRGRAGARGKVELGGAEPPVTTLAQHQQITRCTGKLDVIRNGKMPHGYLRFAFCVTILYLHLHSLYHGGDDNNCTVTDTTR